MIERIVKQLPAPFKNQIKDTIVERYYYHYQVSKIEFVEKEFSTECGDFAIYIPDYADNWYADEHEPKLNSALSEALSPETVFYDVGSQFGYHLQFALKCGVDASNIHSFEANNLRHSILKRSFASVDLVNRQVGCDTADSLSIDSYAQSHKQPDVIKIDVEGAEGQVIKGMEDTLRTSEPVVFIEMHPNLLSDFGHDIQNVYERFDDTGYGVLVTDHRDSDSEWMDRGMNIDSDTFLLRGTS